MGGQPSVSCLSPSFPTAIFQRTGACLSRHSFGDGGSAAHNPHYHCLTGMQHKRLQYFRATPLFPAPAVKSQPASPSKKSIGRGMTGRGMGKGVCIFIPLPIIPLPILPLASHLPISGSYISAPIFLTSPSRLAVRPPGFALVRGMIVKGMGRRRAFRLFP